MVDSLINAMPVTCTVEWNSPKLLLIAKLNLDNEKRTFIIKYLLTRNFQQ